MASIHVDPFSTAKHARRAELAGALLCYASLVGLCLTLWGSLMSDVWRADDAVMADVERSTVAATAVAYSCPVRLRASR